MNKTNLAITGKVVAVLEKTYEGKTTVSAQFLAESESKGFEILKVKLTDEQDYMQLQKDMIVSIPISIAAVNGNIYYSQIDTMKIHKEVK